MSRSRSFFSRTKKIDPNLALVDKSWNEFMQSITPKLDNIIDDIDIYILSKKEIPKFLGKIRKIITIFSLRLDKELQRLKLVDSKLCCTKKGKNVNSLIKKINSDTQDLFKKLEPILEKLVDKHLQDKRLTKLRQDYNNKKRQMNNLLRKYNSSNSRKKSSRSSTKVSVSRSKTKTNWKSTWRSNRSRTVTTGRKESIQEWNEFLTEITKTVETELDNYWEEYPDLALVKNSLTTILSNLDKIILMYIKILKDKRDILDLSLKDQINEKIRQFHTNLMIALKHNFNVLCEVKLKGPYKSNTIKKCDTIFDTWSKKSLKL